MRTLVWLCLWLAFAVSIVGFALATVLWTRRARQLIVSIWLTVKLQEESLCLANKVIESYDEILYRLFLTRTGSVSRYKTLALALASVMLTSLSILFLEPKALRLGAKSTETLMPPIWFFMIFSAVTHWILEYHFCKGFMQAYEKHRGERLSKVLQRCTVAGGCQVMAVTLRYIVLYLAILLIGNIFLSRRDAESLWVMGAAPVLMSGPGALFFSVRLNSIPTAPISAALALLSLSISFLTTVLLALYVTAMNNRIALRGMAAACERLEQIPPVSLFGASMTMFALATGGMQAYTFPTALSP